MLAQAEGLIDAVPAARLQTFDFAASAASGFYLHVRRRKKANRATVTATLCLRNGTTERAFCFRLPPTIDEMRALPYIDEKKLRLWDKDRGCDLELRKGVYAFDGSNVRRSYPKLFAYAQSLDHWNNP